MTESGRRIRDAVQRYLDGELVLKEDKSSVCLTVVRQVTQAGLGIDYDEFYARFRTHTVENNPDPATRKWARDVMLSLREQGRRVAFSSDEPVLLDELEPGDILASWKLAWPIGHISVLLSGGRNALMLENTSTQRGLKVSGYNRLSRVDERPFPDTWEVYRI